MATSPVPSRRGEFVATRRGMVGPRRINDSRPWASSALWRTPAIGVHRGVQGTAAAPAVLFEVWYGFQVADRAQAEPGDRADAGGDAEQLSEELLPVERHPADTELFDGGRQPQVLDGQTHRVQADGAARRAER